MLFAAASLLLGRAHSASGHEQPVRYAATSYGVEDGLSDPVVTTVLQTRDGYLWAGTDNGLSRFDGLEFSTYRAAFTPGLGHDTIRSLFEDPKGVLWIGTQSGLSFFKDGKFERLFSLNTPVTAVTMDTTGSLWIGTRAQGLYQYKGGKLLDRNAGVNGSGVSHVRSIFTDSAGRVWVGFSSGAPACVESAQLRRLELPTPGSGTAAFAEQPSGTLWFANGASVFKLRGGALVRYGQAQGLGEETILDLCADTRGQVWAVAARHLWRLDDADAAAFANVPIATLTQGRHITTDREGNYWIGTAGFGLLKLRPSAFEALALPAGGPQIATTLAIDRGGVASLSLVPNGVVRLAPNGSSQTVETGSAPANEVLSVYSTRDGRLWIGRRSTLLVWRDGQAVEYPEARGVRAIYEDAQGVVWLSSETAGVLRFRNGAFESMNRVLQIRDGLTVSTFAESDGALFIGLLTGGLVRMRGDEVAHYGLDTGAPLDMIRALCPDQDGYLWVGMRGAGLALFRDGVVWNPPALAAPFQGLVSTVTLDDSGHLFVGCSRGIFWASRGAALALARGERLDNPFRRAAESEGLKPAIVGFGPLPTSAKDANGRLWFATRTGVVVVDPSQLASNPTPPQVHILRASIADRAADITSGVLTIPPDGAAIRIDYTATCFARPDLVHFRYRLENQNSAWIDAGLHRFALYNNLPPGTHRIHVIAANESGVWNNDGATLVLVQQPHFYQTLWFRVVVVSAFTAFVVTGARWWARRNLQRRLAALESERRLNRERTRIARDLHDEIGGTVTKIGYLVDRLELQAPNDPTRQLQQQLSRQTRLLASDLDRVIWSVSPANATLPRLATFIATFAQTFLRETPVRCSTRFPPTLPDLPATPELQHHVLAVTKEAINNALKHAHPAQIVIHMAFDGKIFTLCIRDDGCGFDVNHLAHSERNGLSNMRARVAEIGGELVITSATSHGTEIVLRFPLTRAMPSTSS